MVRQDVKSNEPFSLEWPSKAGSYLLRIETGTSKAERFVMLHDWENLLPTVPGSFPQTLVTTKAISGALVGAENE